MVRFLAFLLLTVSLPLLLGTFAPDPSPADTRAIALAEIRAELSLFEDEPRYDYVADDFEYAVIGNDEFDRVFHQSALLAGRFYQIQETRSRYREEHFDLTAPDDADFLTLMSAEAVESLPGIATEAQTLMTEIRSLNPRGLRLLQIRRALRGVAQARENVKMVLGNQEAVDGILDDYEALQADLDTIEEGETG